MSNAQLPSWSEIDAAARASGLAATPSEVHGALCGWLSGGGSDDANWLNNIFADDALPAPLSGSELDRLRQASAEHFTDRDFGFELLLPDEDASLSERSNGLFDWCRGFLGGFGLAAGADPPLSEEGREALTDLANLAGASAQDDGDDEDEAAYAEIEEFVRVAALLLHGDCVMGPRHRQRLN